MYHMIPEKNVRYSGCSNICPVLACSPLRNFGRSWHFCGVVISSNNMMFCEEPPPKPPLPADAKPIEVFHDWDEMEATSYTVVSKARLIALFSLACWLACFRTTAENHCAAYLRGALSAALSRERAQPSVWCCLIMAGYMEMSSICAK